MKRVLVHRQFAVSEIDLRIGLQQSDRPLQACLNH